MGIQRQGSAAVLATALLCAPLAHAGVRIEQDGNWVEFGGQLQAQFHRITPEGEDMLDVVRLRRMRPYIAGSTHPGWSGMFQWELGRALDGNELSIQEAWFRYSGSDWLEVTVGNHNVPFSRENLTSSTRQQLVERTFIGDSNYGTPDKQLGIYLDGEAGMFGWSAAMVKATIDPDPTQLRFASAVNLGSDFLEGCMYVGRLAWGNAPLAQGDLDGGPLRYGIAVAAFTWENYQLLPPNNLDPDHILGYEVSGAVRIAGVSVDAGYNLFDVETLGAGATGGLYTAGQTELRNWALEGGYMLRPQLELVAGYQNQEADNYAEAWTRASFGINYFFHQHDIKTQFTYRLGESLNGVPGNDQDEWFLQGQYVF